MQYILKVSPKGQVVLPKKMREAMQVTDLIAIEMRDESGIVHRPDMSSERIAGCFKSYAVKKKIPLDKALEKARSAVAHEIAKKNR